MSSHFVRSTLKVTFLFAVSAVACLAQKVVARIPTEGTVASFAVNPLSDRIYASVFILNTGPFPNQLLIIDGKTQKLVNTVLIGFQNPTNIAVNPVTGRIYATQCFNNLPMCNVQVFDSEGNSVTTISVFTGSGGDMYLTNIVVNPFTNRIYVGGQPQNGSEVVVIDGNTNVVTDQIEFGDNFPQALAIDSIRDRLFVLNGHGALNVIDCRTNKVIASSGSGKFGGVLDIDPLSSTLYVGAIANSGNAIDFVNENNLSILKSFDLPFSPVAIAPDIFSDQLFVAFFNGEYIVFDGDKKHSESGVANGPLAVNPLTKLLYAVGPVPQTGPPETIEVVSGVVTAEAAH